jgi:DNA-binding transcriptional LysR family regulator
VLDWDDLRFFLSIARHGSLTAAASELRVAQSTVGRRLASLEAGLGVRLLHRTPDGYVLTLAGESVRAQAERAEAEIVGVLRSVGGHDTRLEGLVRVTCTETFAVYVLAPCFAALQAQHHGILLELVPSSRSLSLSMREADVAVRLRPPNQHDLVVRRLGRIAYGLYASPAYLERYGEPDFQAGCPGHRLMTLLGDGEQDAQTAWVTELAPHARLGLQTSSHEALLSTTRSGGGLACLARFRADVETGLRCLETPSIAPTTDIWLVVHKDSRHTPRIRATLTAITKCVRALSRVLDPTDASRSR